MYTYVGEKGKNKQRPIRCGYLTLKNELLLNIGVFDWDGTANLLETALAHKLQAKSKI